MVATDNGHAPPALSAYCVRNDAVRETQDPPLRILDDLYPMQPGGVAVSLCTYDRATHALQLRPRGSTRTKCPVLGLPNLETAQSIIPAVQPVTVHMNSSSICVRARNILRVPLLEVETSKLQAEYTLQADGSVSASAFCSPEVWSYNEHLKEWEEVIQKVPLQVWLWFPLMTTSQVTPQHLPASIACFAWQAPP
jgi:hypothetical protein